MEAERWRPVLLVQARPTYVSLAPQSSRSYKHALVGRVSFELDAAEVEEREGPEPPPKNVLTVFAFLGICLLFSDCAAHL